MQKIEFVKMNPVENMTILVKSKHPREDYGKISEALMDYASVFAEQVGFIEGNHLQMMGGEFCGNASRSFAAYLAFCDPSFQERKDYFITCSSCEEDLKVEVVAGEEEHCFSAKICMPRYQKMEAAILEYAGEKISYVRVYFEGILHCIIDNIHMDEAKIQAWIKELRGEGEEAFGLMFLNPKTLETKPFVYVEGISAVWERSCASGTTAVAYYLDEYQALTSASLQEPGGELFFSIEEGRVYIDGEVSVVAEGKAYIK